MENNAIWRGILHIGESQKRSW